MLLCNVDDVTPGTILGASVFSPAAPGTELLKAGVELDAALIARLRDRGVFQVWIHHDVAADLDAAVAPQTMAVKLEVYEQLKRDFSSASQKSIGMVAIQRYRQAVMELVVQLVADAQFAGLTDQLFSCQPTLLTHGTNVAYIATLVGLELQDYIVRERWRLNAQHARELTALGLGAMLHDIGKTLGDAAPGLASFHETASEEDASARQEPEGYRKHTIAAYHVLRDCRTPASATQVVLNHHQRFDGKGWPAMTSVTRKAGQGPQQGRDIHVFSRIVAAANALDNLLTGAEQSRRPPVAALCEFASARFDGWFDPVIRRAVLRRFPPFAVGSCVTLSDGRDAVVIAPNLGHPCRPAVRPLDGSPIGETEEDDGDSVELNSTDAAEIDQSRQEAAAAQPAKRGGQPGKPTPFLPRSLRITHWTGVPVERWSYDMPPDERQPVSPEQAAA